MKCLTGLLVGVELVEVAGEEVVKMSDSTIVGGSGHGWVCIVYGVVCIWSGACREILETG